MRTFKTTILWALLVMLTLTVKAQTSDSEVKVTLEFENAKTAIQIVQDYTAALQKGDVDKMNAQLHEKAMIHGLGGALDSLNVMQHTDYFKQSTDQYTHSISSDLYLPVKVENNWNEGEWLLSWGTNTITDKKTKTQIIAPYHSISLVEDGKIVFMRYYYDMLNIATSQGFTLVPPKQ
ncbi:MAG: ketosteroid isomerase-like protein [Glaciecola sp.]|jgi:ketosteroid isomerase-like protein